MEVFFPSPSPPHIPTPSRNKKTHQTTENQVAASSRPSVLNQRRPRRAAVFTPPSRRHPLHGVAAPPSSFQRRRPLLSAAVVDRRRSPLPPPSSTSHHRSPPDPRRRGWTPPSFSARWCPPGALWWCWSPTSPPRAPSSPVSSQIGRAPRPTCSPFAKPAVRADAACARSGTATGTRGCSRSPPLKRTRQRHPPRRRRRRRGGTRPPYPGAYSRRLCSLPRPRVATRRPELCPPPLFLICSYKSKPEYFHGASLEQQDMQRLGDGRLEQSVQFSWRTIDDDQYLPSSSRGVASSCGRNRNTSYRWSKQHQQ